MYGVWCEWKLFYFFFAQVYISKTYYQAWFFLEDHLFFSELPLSNISCLCIFIATVYSVPLNSSSIALFQHLGHTLLITTAL